MDIPGLPPTHPAADEESVTAGPAFEPCEAMLQAFVTRGGGLVTERQYWLSPEWGQVLRAKVAFGADATPVPVTCGQKPGEGVQIFVDMGSFTPRTR